MAKILTTIKKETLDRVGIKPPEGLQFSYIESGYSDKEFIEKSEGAEFILMDLSPLNENIIKSLEGVKLIQVYGVGYDGIDVKAAKEAGIPVANAKGVNKVSVSEHTIGLMLASLRRTAEADKDLKAGKFKESYKNYQVEGTRTLKSTHIGIVGLGDIGLEVVKRLEAFGPKISYYSHTRKENLEKEYNLQYLEMDQLLSQVDILTVHTPLTPSTEGMLGEREFKLMKEDSILINTARGEIIDQKDLALSLKNKEIGMAGLDTLSPEPPSKDHPLLNLPKEVESKLILTPHIAGITTKDFEDMQKNAWDNISRVMEGKKAKNIVNVL